MLKVKSKYIGQIVHTLDTLNDKNLELLQGVYMQYISKYFEVK